MRLEICKLIMGQFPHVSNTLEIDVTPGNIILLQVIWQY